MMPSCFVDSRLSFINILNRHKYHLILLSLIVFHSVNNFIWIKKDAQSLGWDVCHHIDITVSVYHGLEDAIFTKMPLYEKASQAWLLFTSGRLEWPRLVHFFAAAISLPSKDILFSFRFSNVFYFIILIISVYLIGKNVSSPGVGVLSALLVSFYPGLFQNSRKFGLDFPLAAWVCLSIYFLLAANNFSSRRYSLLFGIIAGIGALIKGQIIIYIAGPALYSAFLAFREQRKGYFKPAINILLALVISLAVALVWWRRLFSYEMDLSMQRHMPSPNWMFFPGAAHNFFTVRLWGFITDTYLNVSPVLFWVFIVGLLSYLRTLNKKKISILCWLLAPYIILTGFLKYHNYRYTYPIFGAIALISAIGLSELPLKKWARGLIFTLIISFSIVQFFNISYFRVIRKFQAAIEWAHPPRKNNHKIIAQAFEAEIEKYPFLPRNIGLIEERYMNGDRCVRLRYVLRAMNKQTVVILSAGGIYPTSIKYEFLKSVEGLEFLIAFSQSAIGPDFSGLIDFSGESEKEAAIEAIALFRKFKILKSSRLYPDRSYVFLLKRE